MFSAKNPYYFIKSECNLNSDLKAVQNSIESSQYVEYRPVSSNTDDILLFNVPGSKEYLDMSLTKIRIKATIRNSKGEIHINKWGDDTSSPPKKIAKNKHVVPINNFMCSLFSQVAVSLNGKCVTAAGSSNHAYRSYLEKMLNYGPESKKCHLSSSMYYEDEVGEMDSVTSEAAKMRMGRMSETNGVISCEGYLHTDFSSQNKLLASKIDLELKLTRNKPRFSLITDGDDEFTIRIEEAVLLVRKVTLTDKMADLNEKVMRNHGVSYCIDRNEIRTFTVARGTSNHTLENCFLGLQPVRIFMFMIDESSEFSLKKSPYCFEHFKLRLAMLSGDNFHNFPPVRMNVDNQDYQEAYIGLHEAMNIYFRDTKNGIRPKAFLTDHFILGFDCTPDWSASQSHTSIAQSGTMRLQLQFDEPLTKNIKIMLYSEFISVVNVASDRTISTDYAC